MQQETLVERPLNYENDQLLGSTVIATQDVLACDLPGEVVMLDLLSGIYYGLDPLGTRIWEVIQQPTAVSAVCDLILDEYEVDRAECQRDVCDFLNELARNGLIRVVS